MQYTIQDLELVLNNDDLMSYVYFAYNGGYFIIGRDEDIDADDNPRLMTKKMTKFTASMRCLRRCTTKWASR